MHTGSRLAERVDTKELDAVAAGALDSDKLEQARAQVAGLGKIISPSKLAMMLVKRFPREIVKSVLPGVEIPEAPPASTPEAQNPRGSASMPTPIGQLIPKIPREASAPPISVESDAPSDADDSDECQFQFTPWIQCTFPHSDPGSATHYSRVNGGQKVFMSTTSPDFGLPYGVPARLITIYIVSEIVRKSEAVRKPEILVKSEILPKELCEVFVGNSMTEFMRRLGVTITSGKRGTLKAYREQLKRLALAVFSFHEDIQASTGRKGLKIEKELFIKGGIIWDSPDAPAGWGSTLVVSETIVREILNKRAAPLRTDVLAKLRRSPMDLDLYAWLVYRLHRLKHPTVISWAELALQFGQSYERECDFRFSFDQSLVRVKKVYPEAKAISRPEGLLLLPSPHHIPPRRFTPSPATYA